MRRVALAYALVAVTLVARIAIGAVRVLPVQLLLSSGVLVISIADAAGAGGAASAAVDVLLVPVLRGALRTGVVVGATLISSVARVAVVRAVAIDALVSRSRTVTLPSAWGGHGRCDRGNREKQCCKDCQDRSQPSAISPREMR
jgi:hypothetical protein